MAVQLLHVPQLIRWSGEVLPWTRWSADLAAPAGKTSVKMKSMWAEPASEPARKTSTFLSRWRVCRLNLQNFTSNLQNFTCLCRKNFNFLFKMKCMWPERGPQEIFEKCHEPTSLQKFLIKKLAFLMSAAFFSHEGRESDSVSPIATTTSYQLVDLQPALNFVCLMRPWAKMAT